METSSVFIYFVLPVCLTIFFYLQNKFTYWKQRGVASVLPQWIRENNLIEKLKVIYEKFYNEKPLVGVYCVLRPALVLIDPYLIENVFEKDFKKFKDCGGLYNEKINLANDLFAIQGKNWKEWRNKLNPILTTGNLETVISIISKVGGNLQLRVDKFAHEKTTFEGKDVLDRYACDAIVACTFGLDTTIPQDGACDLLGIVNQRIETSFYQKLYLAVITLCGLLPINSYLLRKKEVLPYIMKMVEETETYHKRIENKCDSQLLMQLIFEHEQKPGTFKFYEVATQTFIFLHASIEISSKTMSRALYELAANQNIQEKARQEIMDVVKRHGGTITLDALLEIQYLGQVVNETFRKYPPITALKRVTTERCEVPSGYFVIEKDVLVFIPVQAIHMNSDYYPHPEKFDPDRFSVEEIKKRPPYTFLPFGAGLSNYIGIKFAEVLMKYGLCILLAEYRFQVVAPLETGNWLQVEKL